MWHEALCFISAIFFFGPVSCMTEKSMYVTDSGAVSGFDHSQALMRKSRHASSIDHSSIARDVSEAALPAAFLEEGEDPAVNPGAPSMGIVYFEATANKVVTGKDLDMTGVGFFGTTGTQAETWKDQFSFYYTGEDTSKCKKYCLAHPGCKGFVDYYQPFPAGIKWCTFLSDAADQQDSQYDEQLSKSGANVVEALVDMDRGKGAPGWGPNALQDIESSLCNKSAICINPYGYGTCNNKWHPSCMTYFYPTDDAGFNSNFTGCVAGCRSTPGCQGFVVRVDEKPSRCVFKNSTQPNLKNPSFTFYKLSEELAPLSLLQAA